MSEFDEFFEIVKSVRESKTAQFHTIFIPSIKDSLSCRIILDYFPLDSKDISKFEIRHPNTCAWIREFQKEEVWREKIVSLLSLAKKTKEKAV
jgi:hypothetical protein